MKSRKKRRIGVFFPSRNGGGVFQYALSIADSLVNYAHRFDYAVIHYDGEKPELLFDDNADTEFIAVPNPAGLGVLTRALHFLSVATKNTVFTVKTMHAAIKNKGIDMLIIPTPFSYDLPLGIPFVASIPDYMHKHEPWQNSLKSRIARDIIYTTFARQASRLVADDEQTVSDLVKFARVPADKIDVIPYIPPSYIYKYSGMSRGEAAATLEQFGIPRRYVFFPAQFWESKNHVRLVEALHKIKTEKGVVIPLVLVGSNRGHYAPVFQKMDRRTKELGLERDVYYLGYVEDKEMVALYKQAVALVAPSLQGPTTIPPLEAMLTRTAVITVDKYRVPEEVGDAGLLFDPLDVGDMASKIYAVWSDDKLRELLIRNGTKKVERDLGLETYAKKWEHVLDKVLAVAQLQ